MFHNNLSAFALFPTFDNAPLGYSFFQAGEEEI